MAHVFLAKAPANWKGRSQEHTLSPFKCMTGEQDTSFQLPFWWQNLVLCKGVWEMSLVWWPQAQVNLSYCGKEKSPEAQSTTLGGMGFIF